MNNWTAPQRPNNYAESSLISAILDGDFPPGSTLPGERTLAVELGVTRPTLREAIQRLTRDGWLTVQHGKATQVNDIWHDGGLNVLSALVNYPDHLPDWIYHQSAESAPQSGSCLHPRSHLERQWRGRHVPGKT